MSATGIWTRRTARELVAGESHGSEVIVTSESSQTSPLLWSVRDAVLFGMLVR